MSSNPTPQMSQLIKGKKVHMKQIKYSGSCKYLISGGQVVVPVPNDDHRGPPRGASNPKRHNKKVSNMSL